MNKIISITKDDTVFVLNTNYIVNLTMPVAPGFTRTPVAITLITGTSINVSMEEGRRVQEAMLAE